MVHVGKYAIHGAFGEVKDGSDSDGDRWSMVYNVIQGSKRKHIFLGMEPCNDVVDVNSPERFLGEERAMPEDPSLIDAEPHPQSKIYFNLSMTDPWNDCIFTHIYI